MRGTGFRLKPGLPQGNGDVVMIDIEQGVDAHYAADAMWHNSAIFHTLVGRVKAALRAEKIYLLRTSFASHIGAELLLDRALLAQQPKLAEEFYLAFTADTLSAVQRVLTNKGLAVWQDRFALEWARFVKQSVSGPLSRYGLHGKDVAQHIHTRNRRQCSSASPRLVTPCRAID